MKRTEALNLVKKYVKNNNSIKHMLAVEAVMRSLAKKFSEDEEKWGLVGILHDIDMELVDYIKNPSEHATVGAKILKENNINEDIIEATLAHNEETGKKRETLLQKTIYCTDPLTGLIVASALVLPDRKIKKLSTESVLRRFKEKSFARGANREIIESCKEIGLELEEFISIGLSAMQEISEELEL